MRIRGRDVSERPSALKEIDPGACTRHGSQRLCSGQHAKRCACCCAWRRRVLPCGVRNPAGALGVEGSVCARADASAVHKVLCATVTVGRVGGQAHRVAATGARRRQGHIVSVCR